MLVAFDLPRPTLAGRRADLDALCSRAGSARPATSSDMVDKVQERGLPQWISSKMEVAEHRARSPRRSDGSPRTSLLVQRPQDAEELRHATADELLDAPPFENRADLRLVASRSSRGALFVRGVVSRGHLGARVDGNLYIEISAAKSESSARSTRSNAVLSAIACRHREPSRNTALHASVDMRTAAFFSAAYTLTTISLLPINVLHHNLSHLQLSNTQH